MNDKSFLSTLQNIEGRFNFLAFQVPIIINIVDEKGIILHQNPTIKTILGYDANTRIGKNFLKSKLVHPDDKEIKEKLFANTLNHPNTNLTGEIRLKHKDGTWRWMEIIINNQIANPDVHGIVIFTYDISERKSIEIQKNEFLSIVSHELKTPITTIRAYSQLLGTRLEKDTTKKQEAMFADKIVMQTDKLTRMINELLDASKLQEGKLSVHMEPFQMQSLIEGILEDFQYISDKHTVQVTYSTKKFVIGDQERIRQVLENLLTNAVKYSPKSMNIAIHVSKKGKEVVTSVHDDGEGIPASKQKYVFDRFYRIVEKNARQFSSGLGLYIVSEIIKLHNGKIWLESKKGKGSTFYFTLPIAPMTEA